MASSLSFRIVPSLAAAAPGARVPLWRAEPYRVLFPLGLVLALCGVSPWLAFAFGWTEQWLPVFHAMAQAQCFLACMASGFLFTMIPRRTATGPASPLEIAVAGLAPLGTAGFAFAERWAVSQLCWAASMAVLLQFALRRFRARRTFGGVPSSFVWVIVAFALALASPLLAGIGAAGGEERWWLHDVGRNLALQGVLACLVVGVGAVIVPHVTRGEAPAEPQRRYRLLHLLAALIFAGSFFLEQLWSVPLAHALRALVLGAAFIPAARLWRRPIFAGAHRWLAWLAAWALPVGYALVAIFPGYRKALLHVVFLGSFGALTLAIAAHVVMTHAGRAEQLEERSPAVTAMAACLGLALAARVAFDVDQAHLRIWLGIAACSFIGAVAIWVAIAGRSLRVTNR